MAGHVAASGQSRFLLNREWAQGDPATPLLEFLRDGAGLRATKPSCNTGDCAACLVLVGESVPEGPEGPLTYRAVNSCLMLLAQVAGCHVITLEGLNGDDLTPVQAALVDSGAVQCGYCTPGLVMALTGGLLAGLPPDAALAGNLCRCTGYAGIAAAAATLAAAPPPEPIPPDLAATGRRELARAPRTPGEDLGAGATRVPLAGATDWSPTHRHSARPAAPPLLLRHLPELRGVRATDDGGLRIGAATTVAELAADDQVGSAWPELAGFLDLFASPSIRNLATVGGNLANGSPSADLAVLLLAMSASLECCEQRAHRTRTLPLAALHLGYKVLDLAPGELITQVIVPARPTGSRLAFDKVARRRTDDIAAVNLASLGRLDDRGRITGLVLAAGGVAATPKVLATPAELLVGRELTPATFATAALALADVIAPISDVHGGAGYRRLLLRHLLAGQLAALDPRLDVAAALAACRAGGSP